MTTPPARITVHLRSHPTTGVCVLDPDLVQDFLRAPTRAAEPLTPPQLRATLHTEDGQQRSLTLHHLPTVEPGAALENDPLFMVWRTPVRFNFLDTTRLRYAAGTRGVGMVDLHWSQEHL